MRFLVCLSAYFALVSCTESESSRSEISEYCGTYNGLSNVHVQYFELLNNPKSFSNLNQISIQSLTPEEAGNSSIFTLFLNGLSQCSYFSWQISDGRLGVETQNGLIESTSRLPTPKFDIQDISDWAYFQFDKYVRYLINQQQSTELKSKLSNGSESSTTPLSDDSEASEVFLVTNKLQLPNMQFSLFHIIGTLQKQLRVEESSSNTVNAVAKLLTIISLMMDKFFNGGVSDEFDKRQKFLGQFIDYLIPKKPEVPIVQPEPVPANSGLPKPGSNTQVPDQGAILATGLPANGNGAPANSDQSSNDTIKLPDKSTSPPQEEKHKNEHEGEHASGDGQTLVEPPKEMKEIDHIAQTPAFDQQESKPKTPEQHNNPDDQTPTPTTETPVTDPESTPSATPASNVRVSRPAPDVNAIKPLEKYPGIGVRQNQLVFTEKSAELEALVKKFLLHLPPTDVHNLGTAAVEMIKLHEDRAEILWYVNGLLTAEQLAALPGVYKHEATSTVFAQSDAGGAFVARFNYEPIALEQFVPPLVYDALPKPIRDDILRLFLSVENRNQVQTKSTPPVDASYPAVGAFILCVMLVAVAVVACVGAFLGAQRLLLVLSAYRPVDTDL